MENISAHSAILFVAKEEAEGLVAGLASFCLIRVCPLIPAFENIAHFRFLYFCHSLKSR
jgi:hypothetical protein